MCGVVAAGSAQIAHSRMEIGRRVCFRLRSFKTHLGHRFISLQTGLHQHSVTHSHQSIVAYALPVGLGLNLVPCALRTSGSVIDLCGRRDIFASSTGSAFRCSQQFQYRQLKFCCSIQIQVGEGTGTLLQLTTLPSACAVTGCFRRARGTMLWTKAAHSTRNRVCSLPLFTYSVGKPHNTKHRP